MNYLLDTNICIAILHRKEKKLIQKLKKLKPHQIKLCSMVKAELIYGAYKSNFPQENLKSLENFFEPFESLPFDDQAIYVYGKNFLYLKQKGTPIGGNDLIIASIALSQNLILLTRNEKEFRRLPDLKMEAW